MISNIEKERDKKKIGDMLKTWYNVYTKFNKSV